MKGTANRGVPLFTFENSVQARLVRVKSANSDVPGWTLIFASERNQAQSKHGRWAENSHVRNRSWRNHGHGHTSSADRIGERTAVTEGRFMLADYLWRIGRFDEAQTD